MVVSLILVALPIRDRAALWCTQRDMRGFLLRCVATAPLAVDLPSIGSRRTAQVAAYLAQHCRNIRRLSGYIQFCEPIEHLLHTATHRLEYLDLHCITPCARASFLATLPSLREVRLRGTYAEDVLECMDTVELPAMSALSVEVISAEGLRTLLYPPAHSARWLPVLRRLSFSRGLSGKALMRLATRAPNLHTLDLHDCWLAAAEEADGLGPAPDSDSDSDRDRSGTRAAVFPRLEVLRGVTPTNLLPFPVPSVREAAIRTADLPLQRVAAVLPGLAATLPAVRHVGFFWPWSWRRTPVAADAPAWRVTAELLPAHLESLMVSCCDVCMSPGELVAALVHLKSLRSLMIVSADAAAVSSDTVEALRRQLPSLRWVHLSGPPAATCFDFRRVEWKDADVGADVGVGMWRC